MAVGDSVTGISTIGAETSATIQPAGTEEWIIHNIYFGGNASIGVVQGSSIWFDNEAGPGALSGYFFHLTNSHYFLVKNNSSGSICVSYDGIISKV
jgi:hypothetical protein